MSAAWIITDSKGEPLPGLVAASRLDVGRKVVQRRYDPFRLHVSASYREVFDRDLHKVLAHNDWRIIRIKTKARRKGEPAPTLN